VAVDMTDSKDEGGGRFVRPGLESLRWSQVE
jgi:hypothetical protein